MTCILYVVLFRLPDAIKFLRNSGPNFWIFRIIKRIVHRMKLRDKMRVKDLTNNCSVSYFVSCMPLIAKKTETHSRLPLVTNLELNFLHVKTWTMLEKIMHKIVNASGAFGGALDEDFDTFYEMFHAFCRIYRQTSVSDMLHPSF